MIEVTRGQYKYAAALSGGAMTTRDLANRFCVTGAFAAKVMVALRKAGVVKSTHVKGCGAVYRHELIVALDDVRESGERRGTRHPRITDAEVEYVAELRNEGMTGQAMLAQFQKRYPERKTLKNVIPRAVERGLCL